MQPSHFKLTEQITVSHSPDHLHVDLSVPHRIISSAPLNGGECFAEHIVNMRVSEIRCEDITEPPATTIANYCTTNNWRGTCVGMMTSASMASFRIAEDTTQGVKTAVLVTTGLSNARRAGDLAEHRLIGSAPQETGTINIILSTTARLSPAALIECVQMITEAKVVACEQHNIKSPVSGLAATGTGTDAIVIINGQGPVSIAYCGKHMLFGEILAKLVVRALTQSFQQSK